MIILVGKSGSGKTSIAKELEERYGIKKVVTCTTRPMRPGEVQDKDYHFMTEEEFVSRMDNGEFAETAEYNASFGHCFYGSLKKDYEDNSDKKLIILNPYGLREVREKHIPGVSIYLGVDDAELRYRLTARGDSPEEIERRLAADNKDFSDISTDASIFIRHGINIEEVTDMVADTLSILGVNLEEERDSYENE